MAQQQLYINPKLEKEVVQRINARSRQDSAFKKMLCIVNKALLQRSFNPYHQAARDNFAVDKGIFERLESDIVIVIDKNNEIICFQCSNAFQQLLPGDVEKKVVAAFDVFSTLQPCPSPDMTRHGLHWLEWLVENPHLDFRNPDNNAKNAKSGVFHFGARCQSGDPDGKKGITATKDSRRCQDYSHVVRQLKTLRYGAFGACTEVLEFFFKLLDPDLLEEYRRVARRVTEEEVTHFETRRGDGAEPFVLRALLVNLMTTEHKDESDWQQGFACLAPLGDFEGADLVLREFGLQLRSPPGCIQLFRGRELKHSISKWTGPRRFVVVCTAHEAVRRWADPQRVIDYPLPKNVGTSGSCFEVSAEDRLPEDSRILSEREMFPETWVDERDMILTDRSSEASITLVKIPADQRLKSKPKLNSSSDASAEPTDAEESKPREKRRKLREREANPSAIDDG